MSEVRWSLITVSYNSAATLETHWDGPRPADDETARVFAAYQSGIVARLACATLTPADQDTVARMLDAVIAQVDDPLACSAARHLVFGFLSEHAGNSLQHLLVDEASLALARMLRDLEIPVARRHAFSAACTDLAEALRRRDPDASELACRTMHGGV